MIVTVESSVLIEIPPPVIARSAGIHVSSIIRVLATELGILQSEVLEELSMIEVSSSLRFADPIVALRVCMGLAWEDWYIPKVLGPLGVVDHPGEYQVDSIFMSPDGMELSQIILERRSANVSKIIKHFLKVHEVKCTYKSTNTVGETAQELQTNNFMWMAQIKAYCKALKTRFADLHVLFVNSDYSWPLGPQKKIFHLEFTQEEVDDNWGLLTEYCHQRLIIEGREIDGIQYSIPKKV